MISKPENYLLLLAAAVSFLALTSQSLVLTPRGGCIPYTRDLDIALLDFVISTRSAASSLNPEYRRIVDWFGLLEPLFPSLSFLSMILRPEDLDTLQLLAKNFGFFNNFDMRMYSTFADAQSATPRLIIGSTVHPDVTHLDTLTILNCDPTVFVKVEHSNTEFLWLDTSTNNLYIIISESEICPPGLKTRLAAHRGEPFHFIIILCPEVLTQTPGKFKMFASIRGDELTNTRPYADPSLDMSTWVGMHIDQLRERTLSVYLGRMIIYIQAQKYSQNIAINSMPQYRNFSQATTLPWTGALSNLDSFSLFITGAGFYYYQLRDPDDDSLRSPPQLQEIYRWNDEGILYYASAPTAYMPALGNRGYTPPPTTIGGS